MYLNIDSGKLRDVVAFGRATIDLYANEIGPMEDAVTFHKYVGGSPANTAVAMSRLGLSVGYIGKVSDDQFGRFITRYLAKQGVDVSHIALAGPGIRSGVTMGEILPERCSYLMYRTNCADLHIDCAQLDESYLCQPQAASDLWHISLPFPGTWRQCFTPSLWHGAIMWQ